MPNRRSGRKGKRIPAPCSCTCDHDDWSDSDYTRSEYEDFIADMDARQESFRVLYEHRSLDEIELEIQKCNVVLDKLDSLPNEDYFASKNISFANITRSKLYALRKIKDSLLKDSDSKQSKIEEQNNATEISKKKKKKRKIKKKSIDPNDSVLPTDAIDILKDNSTPALNENFNLRSARVARQMDSYATSTLPVPTLVKSKPLKTKGNLPIKTRSLKVTIKGLPTNFNIDELKSALQEKDFNCVKVIQFKKRTNLSDNNPTYRDIPVFLVILPDSTSHRLIYKLDKILDFDISVERYKGGGQKAQCYKCQKFGHAQRDCTGEPRCMKCAGPHLSFQCEKDPVSPPKCCNCREAQTANFVGCSYYIANADLSKRGSSLVREKINRLIKTLESAQRLFGDAGVEAIMNMFCPSSDNLTVA